MPPATSPTPREPPVAIGILQDCARARRWPVEPAAVAAGVAALSARYNRDRRAGPLDPAMQAARLLFFFPRDVEKGREAVAELVALRLVPDRPLRVLDLGAGLGATTVGVAAALRDAGLAAPVHATLIDTDTTALSVARDLAAHVPGLTVDVRAGDLGAAPPGPWDLVLLGQVLCELDPSAAEAERVAAHTTLLRRLRDRLAADGALVVVEPALREPTRHLHRVRDALAAGGIAPFAPCRHAAACPMLRRDGDWCHEHRAVDLPAPLAAIARAAGLRWEGLTFAYLVLRRDDAALPGRFRVVSEPLPSKGRVDWFLCGAFADAPDRRKVGRLDRHATDTNAAADSLVRGALVDVDPPTARVGPDTRVVDVTPRR